MSRVVYFDEILRTIRRGDDIFLANCVIRGRGRLSNSTLLNKVVSGAIRLVNCSFEMQVNFLNARFMKDVTLVSVSFIESAVFEKVEFYGRARFVDVVFRNEANFSDARFMKTVDFSGSVFHNLRLSGSEFTSIVDFSECSFREISFINIAFYDHVGFSRVEFEGEADFVGIAFGREPELYGAQFQSDKIRQKVLYDLRRSERMIRIFIVHGHADDLKLELKNFLWSSQGLALPEPIILHEQPNLGRTIIEKFEDYSEQVSLVFVILTPDDVVSSADCPNEEKYRARQNVIFEMGYFLGMMRRQTGRVILLHKPPLELPSDIAGLVYIDISNGIMAAAENIRREVRAALEQASDATD